MSDNKQKSPKDYPPHHMGDERRFHVRTYNGGLWQVYGVGLEHIAECPSQGLADMVADALEQVTEIVDAINELRAERTLAIEIFHDRSGVTPGYESLVIAVDKRARRYYHGATLAEALGKAVEAKKAREI